MSLSKENILEYLLKQRELQKIKIDRWLDRLNQKLTESEYYEARLNYSDYEAMFEVYDEVIHQIKMGKFDEKK